MQLKSGVRLHGVRPEVVLAMSVAEGMWRQQGVELVVTSVVDGVHKRSSKHFSGCAFDGRIHGLPAPATAQTQLQGALGPDFDVVLEALGTPNAHMHVEWDPKEPL